MTASPAGRRILVVDDEEDIRQLVSRILQETGFQADLASDGREAIERMTSVRPDLVILDLMMPEVDGWAVLAHARRMPHPPLVLVMTARADHEVLQRATREGASAVISKPFRFHELVATCHGLTSEASRRPSPEGAAARRSPRRVLRAEVTVLSKEAAPFFIGALVNVSLGGAQLELDIPLDVGATVGMAFRDDVRAETARSLTGRIHWRTAVPRGFAHGLSFEALGLEQRLFLQELLEDDRKP
jgi:CheY-like chemotaxis protein